MIPSIKVIQNAASTTRHIRSPKHNFYLKHRPWHIQPTFIAPVLPGETLVNLNMQARTVTDPIANPIIGWWLEHYVFYVKLRDLKQRDLITSMFLTPGADVSALDDASLPKFYHKNGTDLAPNWALKCMDRVVEEYFRDEGETTSAYAFDSQYIASIGMNSALQSAINVASLNEASNIDQDLTSTSAGQGDASAKVWTSEIERAMQDWSYARFNASTQMTFEDWCEAYGVRMPKEELLKPELIRFSRDWTYPTNTIDPTSGAARSACSWSTQLRADKDRFFKEPGFLCGYTVARPKVYLGTLDSSFAMLLRDARSWLPPHLAMDPAASYVKVTAGDPPLDSNTGAYLVDIKDLFLHGDQFINFDHSAATDMNVVQLPNAALSNKKYAASTDADNLFVTKTAGVGMVRQDGVVSLTIKGRQVETSPVNVGNNNTI